MKKPDKFESIVAELEKIVDELDDSIGLEEALQKFERGMILAETAESRLKTIENKFNTIKQKFKSSETAKKDYLNIEDDQSIAQ